MTDLELYQAFKAAFPNNFEPYAPTVDNIARWKWHLAEQEKMPGYELVQQEPLADWDEVISRTRREYWLDLPAYMRAVYVDLSGYFPGVQLWACGSRVNGGYVEKWSSDQFRQLRLAAGRSNKDSSDYDFFAPEGAHPVKSLPNHFDRVRYLPPGEHLIEIPMWDFTKLPEHEHSRVISALDAGDHRTLIDLHNTYKLSQWIYCCAVGGVINWFTYGVESGQIKKPTAEGR